MAKQLSDLTVQLSGAPYSFLWPENAAFLNGTRRHPDLYYLRSEWLQDFTGCLAPVLVFIPILLFLIGRPIASVAVWHSPLAVETTAMIDDYRDGTVYYHYFVGNIRHDKAERSSRFEPAWDSVEPTNPVVYLTFDQSMSRLDLNVRKLNLGVALILPFLSLYVFIVWKITKDYRRKVVLRGEATHLLKGRIFMVRNTWTSPLTIYTYIFLSPTTGAEISGHFSLIRASKCNSELHQGTMVAVLYRDDKLHIVL